MSMTRFWPSLAAWPRQALMGAVRVYRLLLSPWLGNQCRFAPSCSAYAIEALERHGALAGSYLAAGRLLRCQPWCQGGCDLVPAERPRLFTHLLPGATVASAAGPSTTLSGP
jgi:hypothetical protein